MTVAPNVKIVEFDITSATSGMWVNYVNTSTRALNFGAIDNIVSGVVGSTKVIAASGVEFNGNSVIHNMKFYLISISDWTTGDFRFLMDNSNTWTTNKVLTTSDDEVPTSPPSSQNYYRLGGGTQITGSGQVDGLGQWLYLAVYAGTSVPDGTYGGVGGGGFRARFSYDYY